jgi:HPt (histidine-containing phosphotransfer) domain-containing protein
MGNYPVVHRQMIAHFLSSSQTQLAHIAWALDEGQCMDAAEEAHNLKSAARTVGAMHFGNLCEQLEHAGRVGDEDACHAFRECLVLEMAAVTKHLNTPPS